MWPTVSDSVHHHHEYKENNSSNMLLKNDTASDPNLTQQEVSHDTGSGADGSLPTRGSEDDSMNANNSNAAGGAFHPIACLQCE